MTICSEKEAETELADILSGLRTAVDVDNQNYWTGCESFIDRVSVHARARLIVDLVDRFHPEIGLVCPNGGKPHWRLNLGKGTEPAPAVQLLTSTNTATETVVVPKKGAEKKAGEA